MTRLLSTAIFIFSFFITSSSQILDPQSRHLLLDTRREAARAAAANGKQLYLPSIIKLNAGESAETLEAGGAIVLRQRDNLVLAFLPTDNIDFLLTFSGINRVSLGRTTQITLDKGRPFGNVDNVINPSTEWPAGWNGAGVVTGFCDIGFDPSHPAFKDDLGNNRVKKLVNYIDTQASVTTLTTPKEIAGWITDDRNEYHATHVAGIMAGGYRGNQYYGIAQGSEIVAATSMLTDACILAGAEEIIDYAKAAGRPAVINMSLGSYTGPHDGTSLFNQYLAKLGEEAIVCMAAGNEGERPNTVQLDFSAINEPRSIYIFDCYGEWDGMQIYGDSDFWSSDTRQFSLQFSVFDFATRTVTYSSPWIGGNDVNEWAIASSNRNDEQAVTDSAFDNAFSGYFRVSAEVDGENNRYHIYTSYNVHNSDRYEGSGRYYVMVTLKSDQGAYVDGYADGYRCFFASNGSSSFAKPNSLMSISDIACGDNILVVGAAAARDNVPLIGGGTHQYTDPVGEIAHFTGYGTLADGRSLPEIAAPGCGVISAVSTPYAESHPAASTPPLCLAAEIDGDKYYWGSEGGTSMATPYVAGVIALWLQADPTLTLSQIKEIAQSTAIRDYPDIDDTRWGAGQIDALAGIKKVIGLSGINNVTTSDLSPIVNVAGGVLTAVSSAGNPMSVNVYSCDGTLLASRSSATGSIEIDLRPLPAGIVICSVTDGKAKPHILKIAI